MYLGGVISGPEDGVISDRNLRTRWQNEFRLLLGCCGGASRSDSNPPQQPQTYVWVATARVRPSANSRTGWRLSFAEGGDFVLLPPGVPDSLSIRSPCTVFSTKT